MRTSFLITQLLSCFIALCCLNSAKAANPMWTLTPLTDTTISVPANGSAIVQYQVTNPYHNSPTLALKSVPGINQITSSGNCGSSFTLGYQQSCILTLQILGDSLQGNINDGPAICRQGNALQCYQPSTADALHVTKAASQNTKAYIANFNSNTISICSVTSQGLSDCAAYSDSTFSNPISITLNPANTFAYVSNFGGSTVSVCSLNNAGLIVSCTSISGFNNPSQVNINTSNTYAYVANAMDSEISICTIDQNNGELTPISTFLNSNIVTPQTAQLNPLNNFIYFGNTSNSAPMGICQVNNNLLDNCTSSNGDNTFLTSQGVTFRQNGTISYISNYSNNTISICSASTSTGSLNNCTAVIDPTFDFSGNTDAQLFTSDNYDYLYVPNSGNNTISICPITYNNNLESCMTSTANNTLNGPSSIFLSTFG